MPNPIYVRHPRTREMMNLTQMSAATGLHTATLTRRYRRGLRGEDLIAQPKSVSLSISESKRKTYRRLQSEQAQRLALGWRWYASQFDRKTRTVMAPRLGDVGRQWQRALQDTMGA